MTEEEKKAIEQREEKWAIEELTEEIKELELKYGKLDREWDGELHIYFNAKTLLNLIEKQQKEIEELNNRDTNRLSEIGELRTENSYLKQENEYLNCICESDKDNYINMSLILNVIWKKR